MLHVTETRDGVEDLIEALISVRSSIYYLYDTSQEYLVSLQCLHT